MGESLLLGICDIVGAPEPTGFAITSTVRGLDAMYELYTPAQFALHEAERLACDEGRRVRPVEDVENFRSLSECPSPSLMVSVSAPPPPTNLSALLSS